MCSRGGLSSRHSPRADPPNQTLPRAENSLVKTPRQKPPPSGRHPSGRYPLSRHLIPWADTLPHQTATAGNGTHLTQMHSCSTDCYGFDEGN